MNGYKVHFLSFFLFLSLFSQLSFHSSITTSIMLWKVHRKPFKCFENDYLDIFLQLCIVYNYTIWMVISPQMWNRCCHLLLIWFDLIMAIITSHREWNGGIEMDKTCDFSHFQSHSQPLHFNKLLLLILSDPFQIYTQSSSDTNDEIWSKSFCYVVPGYHGDTHNFHVLP